MTEYNIIQAPNQRFSLAIDENEYQIELRTFRGMMYASCWINGELVEAGARVVPDGSIFSGRVNAVAGGMFAVLSRDGSYPEGVRMDGHDFRFVFIPGEEGWA